LQVVHCRMLPSAGALGVSVEKAGGDGADRAHDGGCVDTGLCAARVHSESRTNWGRSRGRRLSVGGVGELGVPAVEVVGELVVEDTGADLQQQVGAAG